MIDINAIIKKDVLFIENTVAATVPSLAFKY